MNPMTWAILATLGVVGLLNLLAVLLLWVHMDRRSNEIRAVLARVHEAEQRVTRIETGMISAPDVRTLFERMASIEGKLSTQTDMMKTIQEHLLERDE
jgi:uncharacterized membrane protein